jgi:hypothetical protein
MLSILPLEIEELILDHLSKDHSALKMCSLVCESFLPICRKHIFGSIVLIVNEEDHAFERLLRETPKIADYIRKFEYNVQIADYTSTSIQESLKRISRLESLTVRQRYSPGSRFDWSSNPIRPALLHLLHLPTLTHFTLTNIKNFIASDLIPCVNLKYLDIGGDTTVAAENTFPATIPEHSIQPDEFVADFGTSVAIMKLCAARRPDGQPIVDFGSVSKITVVIEKPDESEASQELFRRCHALTNAHISCK